MIGCSSSEASSDVWWRGTEQRLCSAWCMVTMLCPTTPSAPQPLWCTSGLHASQTERGLACLCAGLIGPLRRHGTVLSFRYSGIPGRFFYVPRQEGLHVQCTQPCAQIVWCECKRVKDVGIQMPLEGLQRRPWSSMWTETWWHRMKGSTWRLLLRAGRSGLPNACKPLVRLVQSFCLPTCLRWQMWGNTWNINLSPQTSTCCHHQKEHSVGNHV
jgi:hypothetical protein